MTKLALNRALLARQGLLAPLEGDAVEAIQRLAALQAQQARPPFVALWSRLSGFGREELQRALDRREVVRATTLRGTLHLLGAKDYLACRSTLQPGLDLGLRVLGDRTKALDVPSVLSEARKFLAEPHTFTEVRNHLIAAFPRADERAMGYLVRLKVPLVAVPEETDWCFKTDPRFILAETWLGQSIDQQMKTEDLVLRYLAAYGPATVADMQAWSGIPNLKPAFESLRPRLEIIRDERKRELFDLPDAPRPPEETQAPVKFLADFDNIVLSHADRSRIVPDEYRSRIATKNLLILATFLVDGFVAGTWKVERTKKVATLKILPFTELATSTKEQLAAEAERLARFAEPNAESATVEFVG